MKSAVSIKLSLLFSLCFASYINAWDLPQPVQNGINFCKEKGEDIKNDLAGLGNDLLNHKLALGTVAGAVVGVIGLVKLAKWYCNRPTSVLERAQESLGYAHNKYIDIENLITQVHFDPKKDTHIAQFVSLISEEKLEVLARLVSTRVDVSWNIRNLKQYQRELCIRIDQLQAKKRKSSTDSIMLMRELKKDIDLLLPYLVLYDELWNQHGNYFKALQHEKVVCERYAKDMELMQYLGQRTILNEFKQVINCRAINENWSYPHLTYIECIKSDLKQLQENRVHLAGRYPILEFRMQHLVQALKAIMVFAVDKYGSMYTKELRERENAQLKQEQIAQQKRHQAELESIERQKVHAMKQKSQAETEKAWAEIRKARALEEKNRIERERLQSRPMGF